MSHITNTSIAGVYKSPSADSEQVSQLLFGEPFRMTENHGLWTKGICELDDYEGYVETSSMTLATPLKPTHRVSAVHSHAYATANIKSPAVRSLWRGSMLDAVSTEDRFTRLTDGSYVPSVDLVPADSFKTDWTVLATDMLGTPYLWGGRSRMGVDCSGLVQVALQACGINCPRDTGDQKALGQPISQAALKRGDLVFFPGHVGIMADNSNLLHANAHHMRTVIEPLDDVVARLLPSEAEPITARRRLTR